MNKTKQRILEPLYMEKFACIGSECEDTCCVGWKISIDQSTYKEYEKVNNQELRKSLDENITRNQSNRTKLCRIKNEQIRRLFFFNK
jgi:lysine-N-methylase